MTPEQTTEALRLVEQGLTYPEIAQRLGVVESRVWSTLTTIGTHRDKLRERRNIIWKMKGEGFSLAEIAQAVGLRIESVQKIVTQQNKYRQFH
jgi:DNA-directed RNA polymerase specialized sigma24 family protein